MMHGIDATKLDTYFPNHYTLYNPAMQTSYPEAVIQADTTHILPTIAQSHIHQRYPFDKVIFNFPHSGAQRVHVNRNLLKNFFISTRPHLALPMELTYPCGTSKHAIAQRLKLNALLNIDTHGKPDEGSAMKLLEYVKEIRAKYRKQTQTTDNNNNNKNDIKSNKKAMNSSVAAQPFDHFGRIIVVLRDGEPYTSWDIDVQAATGLYELEYKHQWDPTCWKFYHHKTTDVTHNELSGGSAHIYVYRLTDLGVALAMKEQATKMYKLQEQRIQQYFNTAKQLYPNIYPHMPHNVVETSLHISMTVRNTILKKQRALSRALQHDKEDNKKNNNQDGSDDDDDEDNTTTNNKADKKMGNDDDNN
eukprot:UN02143